jgi:hypothetical protein
LHCEIAYSIALSAVASTVGGTLRPSVRARLHVDDEPNFRSLLDRQIASG